CLIVLSFPAASMAWKTSSTAHRSCAYSFSCWSFSCSMPFASSAWDSSFSSDSRPSVASGSTSLRRNFEPSVTRNGLSRSRVWSMRPSLRRPLAARDAHVALEVREDRDPVRPERRTDLDGLRALGERARHVPPRVDTAERDHVEHVPALE